VLNVAQHDGAIEVTDKHGRAVLITEDDLHGGMIVTFPHGARTSGMAPFSFAFEEDMSDLCEEQFHLAVRAPGPRSLEKDCGCPD
jgi:hypothetical protein